MSRFVRDTRGNATLLAAFLVLILCTLSIVAYTGATLYSTYQTAETELERAANISVDDSLYNQNVRDLQLDIPTSDASRKVMDSLTLAGYTQNPEGDWVRTAGGKTFYTLRAMQVGISGEVMDITATISIPLPWTVGAVGHVDLPLHAEARVLYIN